MLKIKLIFANRVQLRQAATASNYGSHARRISVHPNWLYFSSEDPLFTVGFTLRHLGLASDFKDQSLVAKKYRVYRLFRDKTVSQQYFQERADRDSHPEALKAGEYRYLTEVFDQQSAMQVINQDYCEVMMVHMKLFKSSGSHLSDLTAMLDEADRTAEALNSEISCFVSEWTRFFRGSKSKHPCHQCETDLLNHRLNKI